MNLQRLVEFTQFTHQFRAIARDFEVHGGGRAESDMEHSYQLALIAEYEACQTPEAQFVYSLDKLVPMLNNYTDNGRGWKAKHVDIQWLRRVKAGNVDRSPLVAKYYQELMAELERSPHLFSNPDQKQ